MTCIAGVVDSSGNVFIGGDSAGVGGLDLDIRADMKVFRNGPFLFGFTTSFRMGQLLRWSFVPPERPGIMDPEQFMCTTFIDAVRKCLQTGGFATKKEDAELGGTFIVGYQGRLFTIHEDYQVAETLCGYTACGCGESYAKGSLHSTQYNADLGGYERVRRALEAAEAHSAGVRGPFHITCL